jgi:uncharacterized protein with von Willebrand factor type A (vWA) domain
VTASHTPLAIDRQAVIDPRDRLIGTDEGTRATVDALVGKMSDLRRKAETLGIVTPNTAKRTAFKKDRRARTVAIVDLHSLDGG